MIQSYTRFFFIALIINIIFCNENSFTQNVFTLNPGLEGQHPRILFTRAEAETKALIAQNYMGDEWKAFIDECKNVKYPTDNSILGQQQWWYFSQLGIGVAMTQDESLIKKGLQWLSLCYEEDWDADFVSESTVDLDIAHKLAGFALLYDCMYEFLSDTERKDYEGLLKKGLITFKTRGYDKGDYWTNDYQNNHMHFRATASLYCAVILIDKYPDVQSYADNALTIWKRIIYMMPPDGSNHEGMNYLNYGGQMLYPGLYALKHCTQVDVTISEHYHNVGYYYMHHLVPGMISGFGFGDAYNAAAASGPNYLFQIANFTQDPHLQYMAHRLRSKHSGAFNLRQWFILFNDPLLEKKDLADVPLNRYFDDIGIAVCRSDWGDDATAVAFKCGPMGGKWMNVNRKYREYTPFSAYVNVAHDDPDAGTFLLFSKGEFLTTGDGYEKVDKLTTQNSTFIVDDEIQYGGGGGWSQPKDSSQYAWQKDYFDVNNRVAFSGDMKGVYPGMNKLTRTFVSHKAKYIVIFDDAASVADGRTFEWRLQTTGQLTKNSDKIYSIQKNESNALVQIMSPENANWSTTTNKIGNILRARMEDQRSNKFLVVLWPQGQNMDAIKENISTATAIGVNVLNEGNNEYTLFQKEDGAAASSGDIEFNGNTLLLVRKADNSIQSASLVNGNTFKVNSVEYFKADNRVNFGIQSISGDADKIAYSVGPSFNSDLNKGVTITLGGLSQNTTYYYFIGSETNGKQLISDASGSASIQISLDATYTITVSKKKVNSTLLNETIYKAHDLYENAEEGTVTGTYTVGSKTELSSVIKTAESIASNPNSQSDVDKAVTDLEHAIIAFKAKLNFDFTVLNPIIIDANALHDEAVEGVEEGMYTIGSKAELKSSIQMAEAFKTAKISAQKEIDNVTMDLIEAIALFKSKYVPKTPVTVFSDIPYFGEFNNYSPNEIINWALIEDNDNYVLAMTDISTSSGQFVTVNDSVYSDFEISFKAKSIKGDSENDLIIVFAHLSDKSYCFFKLSSQMKESGVFMRIGGPTKYDVKFEDTEKIAIDDFEWNEYKMVSLDSLISIYKNGELIFELAPDKTLKYKGRVGVGTNFRNLAWFDDINIVRLNKSGLNTSELQDAIDSALIKLGNAVEGENMGEYQNGSKEVFQGAIDDAKSVLANNESSQEDIDIALSALKTAEGIFDSKIVLGIQNGFSRYVYLFPNPASEKLHVFSDFIIVNIELINIYGQKVKKLDKYHKTDVTIDISDLKSGTYIVKLYGGLNNYGRSMFVKQ